MRTSRRAPEGLACGLDDWERELLARPVLEVRALFQADAPQGAGQSETSSPSHPDPVHSGESEQGRKALEALDFDLDAPTNHVHPGRPSAGPVTVVLLPQASEDSITSMEVSSLTRTRLRGGKADRLARLVVELRASSDPGGMVSVAPDRESDWLGANNDIRLVLAQHLGVEPVQDAERIHVATFQEAPEEETSREQQHWGAALTHDTVTWWQESLVSALFGGTGLAQSRGVNDAPIGMFNSGVGGLTVARSALDQPPHEQVLYIGDTANSPYGPRNTAEVRLLALGIMGELADRGVKLLVIACNAVSAVVLHGARERYTLGRGVPVIEVIHPTVRTAARVIRNGKVGLIATRRTVDSRAYDDAPQAVPGVELVSQTCLCFVGLAEWGVTIGPEVLDVAEEYPAPIKVAGVDTLILGHTHYPLLVRPISYVVGWDMTPVTSSDETAKDVYRVLVGKNPLCGPEVPELRHDFASTGDPEAFPVLARRFLGLEVTAVEHAAFAPGVAGVPAGLPHLPSPPTSHQGFA